MLEHTYLKIHPVWYTQHIWFRDFMFRNIITNLFKYIWHTFFLLRITNHTNIFQCFTKQKNSRKIKKKHELNKVQLFGIEHTQTLIWQAGWQAGRKPGDLDNFIHSTKYKLHRYFFNSYLKTYWKFYSPRTFYRFGIIHWQ